MAVELLEIGELFLVVALAGAVALRFGISVIPLYVVGGALSGQFVSGRLGLPYVQSGEAIALLAELGIVMLLFFLGLEFSPDRLLASRKRITRAGLIDLGINFPIGVGIGLVLGWSLVEALLLGGIVYVSSSAIITKSLIDLGWIADAESEPILGTLVFEDLFMALYLAIVTSLVLGSDDLFATLRTIGIALLFLGGLLVVVLRGTRLFEQALDVGSQELFVLRVLGVTVPVAGAALALGVSEAVAAFFVGMGFSTTEHRERIERRLAPVRDVFAAVFFFWIGVETDPLLLLQALVPLVLAILLTTPAKVVSGYYGGRAFDLGPRRSLRVGLGMVSRGEFSLVIAALAASGTGPVMREVIPAFAVGYVLAMSILGTSLMQDSAPFERLLLQRSSSADDAP